MKLEQFKQEIEKLGMFVEVDEHFINVRYRPFLNDDFSFLGAYIHKEVRDIVNTRSVELNDWSRNKQKRFMELCTKLAMTKPEER